MTRFIAPSDTLPDMNIRFALLAPFALAVTPTSGLLAQAEVEPTGEPPHETIDVVLETTMGDIVVALETGRAPLTASNFLRYVDEDRFDGTVFYRTMRLDWGDQTRCPMNPRRRAA